MTIHRSRIAAQLWTVRDHCRDAAALAASLQRIRAIGYEAVQISGVGPIPPAEIRRLCASEGLAICATHEDSRLICDSPQAVVDRLGELGTDATAYPFPHLPLTTLAEVETLAGQLDRAGAVLRRAGMTLCYHNHHHEFVRVAGRSALEWIYALTAPANLQGEPDTYWVQTGGGDPAAWCRRLAGRMPLLHLKDYAIVKPGREPEVAMSAIGAGSLDWTAILSAATAAGCRWYIVEQDICPGDPFACLRQSWDYLVAHHASAGAPCT